MRMNLGEKQTKCNIKPKRMMKNEVKTNIIKREKKK